MCLLQIGDEMGQVTAHNNLTDLKAILGLPLSPDEELNRYRSAATALLQDCVVTPCTSAHWSCSSAGYM